MGTIPLVSTSRVDISAEILQHSTVSLTSNVGGDFSQLAVTLQPTVTIGPMTTITMANYASNLITWESRVDGMDFHIDAIQSDTIYDNLPGGSRPAPNVGGGAAGVTYTHTQAVPAVTWIVPHNLGHRPSSTIVYVGNVEVEAGVIHVTNNLSNICFATPQSGVVILT